MRGNVLSRIGRLCTLFLLISCPLMGRAELALAVQPNAPKADDPEFYQAFANSLAEVLGEDVTYLPEKSWSKFRRSLIANEYDLLIAEPHIAALMALNTGNGGLDFSPLVAVPDMVHYNVIAMEDSGLTKPSDLNGKRVCTPLSPGLAAVVFLNQYKDDPVNPPLVKESKGGVEKSYQSMQRKRCEAMVLTKLELEKLKMTTEGLTTIFESRAFPGWSLNISPVLTPERRQQIEDVMVAKEAATVKELYQALSKQSGSFIPKGKNDFEDYNILPGVVWGW